MFSIIKRNFPWTLFCLVLVSMQYYSWCYINELRFLSGKFAIILLSIIVFNVIITGSQIILGEKNKYIGMIAVAAFLLWGYIYYLLIRVPGKEEPWIFSLEIYIPLSVILIAFVGFISFRKKKKNKDAKISGNSSANRDFRNC